MIEFQHVSDTDGGFVVKRFSGASVIELDFRVLRVTGAHEFITNLLFGDAVERRSRDFISKFLCREPEMGFKGLSQVHTGYDAEGGENNINRCAVRKKRHVFRR